MADITLLNGLVGGLLATIVMTVFMIALGDDSPPPTALFVSKYLGDGSPEDYMLPGMALHVLYGIGAAVIFVLGLSVAGLGVGALGLTTGYGFAWGFILFVGAAVFWMRLVLDMEPEPPMVGLFLLFHLVYGGVLGAWLSLGLI